MFIISSIPNHIVEQSLQNCRRNEKKFHFKILVLKMNMYKYKNQSTRSVDYFAVELTAYERLFTFFVFN